MQRSETINKLAAALSAAQAEMKAATKDAKGNFGNYANLESVWDAAGVPLAKHKLAVMQMPGKYVDGCIELETVLMHESGEFIANIMHMKAPKADPHGFGSALTYARRYALAAFLGIHQSDDDGQSAVDQIKALEEAEAAFKANAQRLTAEMPELEHQLREAPNIAELKQVWESIKAATAAHPEIQNELKKVFMETGMKLKEQGK